MSQQAPNPARGRWHPTNAGTCCRGARCPAPSCHHNEPKQGPGPEPEGGDKATQFSRVRDLPANLDTSFSEPAPPLEERVATASARVTHSVHPPVSSLWSHASEQPWGIGARGFPTRELHAASWTDRGQGDCRLCLLGRKSGAGPPGALSPPACQDSAHVHPGEGGSRGQRSNSGHMGGPRPLGKACTRTGRGAELDLRQDWRPGKPGVAAPTPHKLKVTRAGAVALTFHSCLGYL